MKKSVIGLVAVASVALVVAMAAKSASKVGSSQKSTGQETVLQPETTPEGVAQAG